jgi:magnesium transporter
VGGDSFKWRLMMKRLSWKTSKKVGMAPGELIHVGERKMEDVRFHVMNFDLERFEEKELATIEECFPYFL